MLFLADLLKFKTTFGKLWLAGTVGVKKSPFNRNVIEKSNIQEFVVAMLHIQVPLSPRLSGIFLRGLCAIYEQKWHLLQLEVQILFRRLHDSQGSKELAIIRDTRTRKCGVSRSNKRVKTSHQQTLNDLWENDTQAVTNILNAYERQTQNVPLTQLELNQSRNITPLPHLPRRQLSVNSNELSSPYCCVSTLTRDCSIQSNKSPSVLLRGNTIKQFHEGNKFLQLDDHILNEETLYRDLMWAEAETLQETELKTPAPVLHHSEANNNSLNVCEKTPSAKTRSVRHGICRDRLHTNLLQSSDLFQEIVQSVSPVNRGMNQSRVTMVLKQKHVTVLSKFFDNEIILDDGTLKFWESHLSPLLRHAEKVVLHQRTSVLLDVSSVVEAQNQAYQPSRPIKRSRYSSANPNVLSAINCNNEDSRIPTAEGFHNEDPNIYVRRIASLDRNASFLTTIEKLRGGVAQHAPMHFGAEFKEINRTGNDLKEFQRQALQKNNRLSFASSYISDTIFETNDRSSMENTSLDFQAPFYQAPQTTRRSCEESQEKLSHSLWSEIAHGTDKLQNGLEGNAIQRFLLGHEEMGNKVASSSPLSSLSSSEKSCGLLPLSIETTQFFFQTANRLFTRETNQFYSSTETSSLLNSLKSILDRSYPLHHVCFADIAPPSQVDALSAAHTFYCLLKLSSSGEVGFSQTSFDAPLFVFVIPHSPPKTIPSNTMAQNYTSPCLVNPMISSH